MSSVDTVATVDPRKKVIDIDLVRKLLEDGFRKTKIADMIGVSVITLTRRMKAAGFQVKDTYASLPAAHLNHHVNSILENHPNTGYKTMRGFLHSNGLKCTVKSVRQAMAEVDPIGTMCRKMNSRVIVRRRYHCRYSNEIWHIDTNLKLIRYKFVIKGAIDGKSRYCVYLDVADNNTSESQLQSFTQGVREVGIPIRTRSDKGGENRGIASFMLFNRGLNRGSHICGRSVHNQRIERFWVDTWEKVILQYTVLFGNMEDTGLLNINSDLHMAVLHFVFLKRIQSHLHNFRNGWNSHPVSTENGYTPYQLLINHMHPPSYDVEAGQVVTEELNFACNTEQDVYQFNDPTPLTFPHPPRFELTDMQYSRIATIDVSRFSESYGMDVFKECIDLLNPTE